MIQFTGGVLLTRRGWPDRATGPMVIELEWASSRESQRVICVGAKISTHARRDDPQMPDFEGPFSDEQLRPLTIHDWRVPLASIITEERQWLAETIAMRSELGPEYEDDGSTAWSEVEQMFRAPSPRTSSVSHEEVADVYNGAATRGEPPVQAVASRFVISASAARGRVARARAAGYLPKNPGRGRKAANIEEDQ